MEYAAHQIPIRDIAFEKFKAGVGSVLGAGGSIAVEDVDFCSARSEDVGGGVADAGCSAWWNFAIRFRLWIM